jgi:hypothetical protein
VSDGPILEKIEKDLCGWLEDGIQEGLPDSCVLAREDKCLYKCFTDSGGLEKGNFHATTWWFDKFTKQAG